MKIPPGPPYPGVYEHYKGDIYVVHRVITDRTTERDGRILVYYESLETKEFHVCEIIEFLDKVHEDGSPSWHHHVTIIGEPCDECRPRFRMLTPGM